MSMSKLDSLISTATERLSYARAVFSVESAQWLYQIWKIVREHGFRDFFYHYEKLVDLEIIQIAMKHPEMVYGATIDEKIVEYSQLKRAAATLIIFSNDLAAQLHTKEVKLTEVQNDICLLKEVSDGGVVTALTNEQKILEEKIGILKIDFQVAQKDAELAKRALMAMQSEIQSLKTERDTILALQKAISARDTIAKYLNKL